MKINLAKSAGFCLGVKRALKIAMETASINKKVYMLGDIVHNEAVVKQINNAGIKKINRLSLQPLLQPLCVREIRTIAVTPD